MADGRWSEAELTVPVSSSVRMCAGAFVLFAVSIATLIPSRASAQTDPDWDWMRENFGPVFEALMPIHENGGTHVVYRSHHEVNTGVIEYSFVLGHDPNVDKPGLQRSLSAHVRIADSVSIYDQMMKMHRENPRDEVSRIREGVKVKTWNLTDQTCPAIRSQLRRFRAVRFGPPDFDEVVLDPLIHHFVIDTGAGTMDLTLEDHREPLIAWALQTGRALEKCAAQKDASFAAKR
jgi:hypothetical protein